LEIHYDEGTISAATYGRGIWESPLNTLSTNIDENKISSFQIHPNPSTQEITLNVGSQIKENLIAKIYSITGQTIIIKNINNNRITINTSNFSKGCYIVELSNGSSFTRREKLIIK